MAPMLISSFKCSSPPDRLSPIHRGRKAIVVVVTGATGFIGRHLCRELLSRGHKVHALLRFIERVPKELDGVELHSCAGGFKDLDSTLATVKPDVVLHLASKFLAEHRSEEIPELCASNITFGSELAEAMVKNGVLSLVSAGTAWQEFGNSKSVPTNFYSATKEAFTAILRFYADAYGLRVTYLKLYDTYGPKDFRPKLMRMLHNAAGTDEILKLSPGQQIIDLLHVQDAVEAFAVAMQRITNLNQGTIEEFYLRSGERNSLRELVKKSEIASGKQINVEWGARPYRAREVMNPWSRGELLPGWTAKIPLSEGLKSFFSEPLNV